MEDFNAEALNHIINSRPFLIDLKPAFEAIPDLSDRQFLHAGPPLSGWGVVEGALRGSVLGTLIHIGLVPNLAEANELACSGEIQLLSANDHHCGGTYAGVISTQTPVFVVENRAANIRSHAAINEGRGKALRYGSNDTETLSRLAWIEGEFSSLIGSAIRASGGIDLFEILIQALHMGDDGHSRHKAASALFTNALAPYITESSSSRSESVRALNFLAENDIFFLPLTMAAGKVTMEAASGIPGASLVTCMAANGVDFGIKVSGCGDRWFTAPVPEVKGRYFEGYGPEDANAVIGDSEIAETMGLGAFAMAGAPALASYVGGTPEIATNLALEMYDITVSEHERFKIPAQGFRGTPTGIDVYRVVEQDLTPLFNTGIAHKTPGIGQIGAGFVRTPLDCFKAAVSALADET